MNFDELVEFFGGRSAMATALSVSRSAVSQWQTDGIPPARAIEIEALTAGRFRAVDLIRINDEY